MQALSNYDSLLVTSPKLQLITFSLAPGGFQNVQGLKVKSCSFLISVMISCILWLQFNVWNDLGDEQVIHHLNIAHHFSEYCVFLANKLITSRHSIYMNIYNEAGYFVHIHPRHVFFIDKQQH